MSTSSRASSNSSSASRSSASAAASRSAASKPAASKPASTKPPDTKSCHLADPSQARTLRGDLDSFAKQHPSGYSTQVQAMNKALSTAGVGISPCSQQSIKDSLKGVAQGTMTEKQAHAREAVSFAKDSFESVKSGRLGQGAVEFMGSGLNATAAVAMDTFDRLSDFFGSGPASTPSSPRPVTGSGGGGGGGGGGTW